MPLPPDFLRSPYAILSPDTRWFPAGPAARKNRAKLIPPLVAKIRQGVKEFRDNGYAAASPTSRNLLNWWFNNPHPMPTKEDSQAMFQYYFAQREALETIIYLYDVIKTRTGADLIPFDSSEAISEKMFDESWRRYVIKMATGAGKTKVLSLVLAWSFFHKLYEAKSEMSRNFLIIAPNIIVLDRLCKDFDDMRIFRQDPIIPYNGFKGCDWQYDFQLTPHRQDDIRVNRPTGNIFLTNIHRVYTGNIPPSPEKEPWGQRPTGATTDSKVDLGMIVRDIDELAILNDEAHHIHSKNLTWFKCIQDIHSRLKLKGKKLSFQVDTTATPKHNNGSIFVQTVSDYPLVEAISQNIVKHPVLPDQASRNKLKEQSSAKYTEKYGDYINLGVVEWRKVYKEHKKVGKKAILFVMTDDTRNCDDVADYLRNIPDFADKDSVLVIHTKNNGEIHEPSSGKKKEELDLLREQANKIDSEDSPYKAIVSVLVLKEGWDVRNVTTIVGLRPYQAKSNILPEQTLGRGLRKMYSEKEDIKEKVSVIGTKNFMEFVEQIESEGVELERVEMGEDAKTKIPLVIEVDHANKDKDIDALDIVIPVLTPRTYREYKVLEQLDINAIHFRLIPYLHFEDEQGREITFREMTTKKISHKTILDDGIAADYRSIIGHCARTVMSELRLVSGYDVLHGKIEEFVQEKLFGETVDLESANTIRNLVEIIAITTIIDAFKEAVNAMTIKDKGETKIERTIIVQDTHPFIVKNQEFVTPDKSVFNRIIGDSQFELDFAAFLERCGDIVSYTKNYWAVGFKLDYVTVAGEISNYFPDFIVKQTEKRIVIVETKGLEDVNVPRKMERLKQWCADVNAAQSEVDFDFAFVNYDRYSKYPPNSFADILKVFRKYKDD